MQRKKSPCTAHKDLLMNHYDAPPQQMQKRPPTVLCWCRRLAIMTQLSLDEVTNISQTKRLKMNCELHTNVKNIKHAGPGTNTVDSCTDQKNNFVSSYLATFLGAQQLNWELGSTTSEVTATSTPSATAAAGASSTTTGLASAAAADCCTASGAASFAGSSALAPFSSAAASGAAADSSLRSAFTSEASAPAASAAGASAAAPSTLVASASVFTLSWAAVSFFSASP